MRNVIDVRQGRSSQDVSFTFLWSEFNIWSGWDDDIGFFISNLFIKESTPLRLISYWTLLIIVERNIVILPEGTSRLLEVFLDSVVDQVGKI